MKPKFEKQPDESYRSALSFSELQKIADEINKALFKHKFVFQGVSKNAEIIKDQIVIIIDYINGSMFKVLEPILNKYNLLWFAAYNSECRYKIELRIFRYK